MGRCESFFPELVEVVLVEAWLGRMLEWVRLPVSVIWLKVRREEC